jgi:hypothetical protein
MYFLGLYASGGVLTWLASLVLFTDEEFDIPFLWASPKWFFSIALAWPVHVVGVTWNIFQEKPTLSKLARYHHHSIKLFFSRLLRDIKGK